MLSCTELLGLLAAEDKNEDLLDCFTDRRLLRRNFTVDVVLSR